MKTHSIFFKKAHKISDEACLRHLFFHIGRKGVHPRFRRTHESTLSRSSVPSPNLTPPNRRRRSRSTRSPRRLRVHAIRGIKIVRAIRVQDERHDESKCSRYLIDRSTSGFARVPLRYFANPPLSPSPDSPPPHVPAAVAVRTRLYLSHGFEFLPFRVSRLPSERRSRLRCRADCCRESVVAAGFRAHAPRRRTEFLSCARHQRENRVI